MAKKKMKLYKRDYYVFQCARCSSVLNNEIFEKLNIAPRRIRTYCENGYFQKVQDVKNTYYKLTKQGRRVAEKEFQMSNFYHYQSYNHDIEIARKFANLENKENVLSEEDLKAFGDIKNNEASTPDFAYIKDGSYECFEVTTVNYREQEIEQKREFCRTYFNNANITFSRV